MIHLPATGMLGLNAPPPGDSDGDSIDDAWEISNFGNITTVGKIAGKYTDYDRDGYSDLLEFQNRGLTDLNGTLFNPKVKNAPGGSGWVQPPIGIQAAINLLLLEEISN